MGVGGVGGPDNAGDKLTEMLGDTQGANFKPNSGGANGFNQFKRFLGPKGLPKIHIRSDDHVSLYD